jgi:hypothetical protein
MNDELKKISKDDDATGFKLLPPSCQEGTTKNHEKAAVSITSSRNTKANVTHSATMFVFFLCLKYDSFTCY